MKNNILIRSFVILVFSLLLGFVSIFLSYRATQYDLGQLVYVLVVFFPAVAVIIGVLSEIFLKQFWLATVLSGITFFLIFIIKYNLSGYRYILLYVIIASISYFTTLAIRRIFIKIKKTDSVH